MKMYDERIIKEYDKAKNENTSKAYRMFEELGYDEKHHYKEVELYRNSDKCNCIQFDTFNKTFCKFNEDDSVDILDFTMQELQAINEKVKELGWNE